MTTLAPAPTPVALRRNVELTIDGEAVTAQEGTTILQACRTLDIEVPTLCYLETLAPVNVCRVCVVEVEGSRALVPSCSRPVAPGMVARGWGRIIQISSGAAAVGLSRGLALYGASKGAVEAMVRHLAVELGPSGVTVNAVSLGVMDNLAEGDPERYRRAGHAIPVRRLGRPEDAGAAVSWLASEDGAYVTGQIVHVNGGAVFGR